MAAFFISYSRADQETAIWFANRLREAGSSVWFDQVDIRPSDRWDRTIEAALHDCAGLVLMLSPRSAASENVLDEITVAMDARKPVIPVMIETCQPPLRLARVQWIDARMDREGALANCQAALARHAPEPGQPAPAGTELKIGKPPPFAPMPWQLDTLGRQLTEYLGPMARHVVDQEARQASDLSNLVARLKQRIPDPAAAATFVKIERDIALGLF